MEKQPPKVYAVVVTHNGSAWIRAALESLCDSSLPVSIVVVDNASGDDTAGIVRDFCPGAELLCLPANLGFGAANNRGIRHALSAGADYILLLNQDAKVTPEAVGRLVCLMEQHPDFGVLSPLQLSYDGDGIDPPFLSYMQSNASLIDDALLHRLQGVYEVPFVNAAVWMVRRTVFDEVGGFDPLFFMYGEDNDYCSRVRCRGFHIGIAPNITAHHRKDAPVFSSLGFKDLANRYYVQAVHLLKRPDRSFFRNMPGLIITWCRQAVHAGIECEGRRAGATLASLLKAFFMLPQIWLHRRISMKGNKPWL